MTRLYREDRHSAGAATAAEIAATALAESTSAETALKCALNVEIWAANETSNHTKAVAAASSYAAQRATELSVAESTHAEMYSVSDVRDPVGKKNELASVANTAEDAIGTAAMRPRDTSADVSFHEVDALKSSSSRAIERSTLASLDRIRMESAMTAITPVVKERQNDARRKMRAATLVRNAYTHAVQEVSRAQSLQFAAENRLAAVRADSRNVVNGARRHYEKMKTTLDASVAQQMAMKQKALKLRIEQVTHAKWAAAEMWDKELQRESMAAALRERASRHWRETQRNFQLARKAQEATAAKLENSVQEMLIAAQARDCLRAKTAAAIVSVVDARLSAEEVEAAVTQKVKDAVAVEREAWKDASLADEAVAAALLFSAETRHARKIARARAENDLDARNAAITTLCLQKERREACTEDLARSNAALLEAECTSAEVGAAVRKNAASLSMSTAALSAVAHAREHVMSMASELKEAAAAVEDAEEIVRKWEASCAESSIAVSKSAAKELKALESEAAAVTKALSVKTRALALSKACIDVKQELEHEERLHALARRKHEAFLSSAEQEDGIAARRMQVAEAEFAAMHLASEQEFIHVENASKAEVDARLQIKAAHEYHALGSQKPREAPSADFPVSRREEKILNGHVKESFGNLLTSKQKDSLTRMITNLCMRRARATLTNWCNHVEERRRRRHVVQLSLRRFKAGTVLRAFHSWRSHTAKKHHDRMTSDVFTHAPLTTVYFKAVRKGMLRAVRACISKGLDPKVAQNVSGQTALHVAAAAGNVAMVNALLRARVPVNMQDRNGRTALHYAVENSRTQGHEDVIRSLLSNFASTSVQDKFGVRAFEGVEHRGR